MQRDEGSTENPLMPFLNVCASRLALNNNINRQDAKTAKFRKESC